MRNDFEEKSVEFDRCFICEGPRQVLDERPSEWVLRRSACDKHFNMALLPTGETLASFLERRRYKNIELGGYGGSFLVNPVTVAGTRGWVRFYMGAQWVFEDVFSSSSFAEHEIQHDSRYLNELYKLHIAWRPNGHVPSRLQRLRYYSPMLNQMLWMLFIEAELAERLREEGVQFPKSLDDVWQLERSVRPGRPWNNRRRWIFTNIAEKLMDIARRRFAHLDATSNSPVLPAARGRGSESEVQ